jgi:hypothetical protein
VSSIWLVLTAILRQNAMMFETLYRADPRGKSFADLSEVEYFQPRIDREKRGEKYVFFGRETHGYFDDQRKKLENLTETFNPEEPFESWDEAQRWYEQQLKFRASTGFVHAFAWDPMSPSGMNYRVLDPH